MNEYERLGIRIFYGPAMCEPSRAQLLTFTRCKLTRKQRETPPVDKWIEEAFRQVKVRGYEPVR